MLGLGLMLFANACKEQKPAPAPTAPSGKPPAKGVEAAPVTPQAPSAPAIVSVESNSFDAVTALLDRGGSLFVYVGTERWLKGVSQKIGEFRDVFQALPDQSPEDREMVGNAFELIQRLVNASGVENVSGVGRSGIALEKGFYRRKLVLHHYPGQGVGNLWTSFGVKPHPLSGLDLLPASTALAFFFDVEPQEIWATIEKEAVATKIPALVEGVRKLPEVFKSQLDLDIQKTLASLGGGEVGIVLTLDDSKPVTIPLPDRRNLTLPTMGLMVAVKVVDDTIFDRLDQQFAKDPNLSRMVQRVDEKDLRMRIVPVPIPVPMPIRPTVARHGDYLLLASSDDLVRTAVGVKTGKSLGLKSTAEFKRLAKDLPALGNGFGFVSQKYGETISALLQDASRMARQNDVNVSLVLGKLSGYIQVPNSYVVAANTPEGWVLVGNGSENPGTAYVASSLMAPVGIAAIAGGLALPALAKAKQRAQQVACINNLRQIELAKEQWALEKRQPQTATPNWDDLAGTGKFIPTQPQCPAGGNYTIGSMTEKPTCSRADHSPNGNPVRRRPRPPSVR